MMDVVIRDIHLADSCHGQHVHTHWDPAESAEMKKAFIEMDQRHVCA